MRAKKTSKIIPRGVSDELPSWEQERLPHWDGQSVDWAVIVANVLHPVKVAIIEALAWVEHPLSPSLMEEMFADDGLYLSLISYHANSLCRLGVIEIVATRPARGALERFYFFSDPSEK